MEMWPQMLSLSSTHLGIHFWLEKNCLLKLKGEEFGGLKQSDRSGDSQKNKRKITRITLRDQPTNIAGWKMGPFDFSRFISKLKMGKFPASYLSLPEIFAAFLQFGEFFSTSKTGQRLEQTSMFRREMF